MFLDESAHVARRARLTRRPPRKKKSPQSDEHDVKPVNTKTTIKAQSLNPQKVMHTSFASCAISWGLPPDLEELAFGYFFSKYVVSASTHCDKYDLDGGNGCLVSSIRALGTAGATRTSQGPSWSSEAQKQYLIAIQRTNEALRSPEYVKRDSTLLAINILGIFETTTGVQRTIDAWRGHVHGAAALLQLRGSEQFDSQTGCRLYMQTCSNLTTSCMQQRMPIPEYIWEIQKQFNKLTPNPAEIPLLRSHVVSLRLTDLLAQLLPDKMLRTVSDGPSVLIEALSLYQELESILTEAPSEWRPRKISARGPMFFADYFYTFDKFLVCQIWCAIACYKIMLCDIMVKTVTICEGSPDFYLALGELELVHQHAASVRQSQLDIIAAVPQHLGVPLCLSSAFESPKVAAKDRLWTNFGSHVHTPFPSARTRSEDLPHVRLSGGYLIQWSLFVVANADVRHGTIRSWVHNVLTMIGQAMGVQQALILANKLVELDQNPNSTDREYQVSLPVLEERSFDNVRVNGELTNPSSVPQISLIDHEV